MNNCLNCNHARKAYAKDHVACAYYFKNYEMDCQKIMEFLNLEQINTGWGHMKRYPDDDGKQYIVGSGIITNNVPVFHNDFSCCNYEERWK